MNWFSRPTTILKTVYRYGLTDIILPYIHHGWVENLVRRIPQSPEAKKQNMPVRLRLALESLGPIFVKLGQVLSTSTN